MSLTPCVTLGHLRYKFTQLFQHYGYPFLSNKSTFPSITFMSNSVGNVHNWELPNEPGSEFDKSQQIESLSLYGLFPRNLLVCIRVSGKLFGSVFKWTISFNISGETVVFYQMCTQTFDAREPTLAWIHSTGNGVLRNPCVIIKRAILRSCWLDMWHNWKWHQQGETHQMEDFRRYSKWYLHVRERFWHLYSVSLKRTFWFLTGTSNIMTV